MGEIGKLLAFLVRLCRNLKHARLIIGIVIFTSVLGGLASTLLVAMINSVLTDFQNQDPNLLWKFLALCVGLLVFNFVPQILLAELTQRALYDWRLTLCRRILASPLAHLERLGPERLLATMTNDLMGIAAALRSLPMLAMRITFLLGCLAYLGWLSNMLLVGLVVYLVVAITTYQLPLMKGRQIQGKSREIWDVLFKHLRAITEGTKELKMHYGRRDGFMSEELDESTSKLKTYNLQWRVIFAAAGSWGQVLFFALLGLLLFAVPKMEGMTSEMVIQYVVTFMYMMGPIESLMGILPGLTGASIAASKMEELGLSLGTQPREPEAGDRYVAQPSWETLEVAGVTHAYHREGETDSFTLGPINLSFKPGELVFIVGGNGSGKTTLAKLLLGLYAPEGGEIRLDGESITTENRDWYRQFFSAVFTDFFLFEKLFGLQDPKLDSQTADYLKQLQLSHKVTIQGTKLSTVNLSQGQRKRLALLTAYLEDRPIYLFDEWAADQDPLFKQIFYCQLLPELRSRGKTVIVISHDDRYYPVADRIVRLNYGQIDSDLPASEALARMTDSLPGIELQPVTTS